MEFPKKGNRKGRYLAAIGGENRCDERTQSTLLLIGKFLASFIELSLRPDRKDSLIKDR